MEKPQTFLAGQRVWDVKRTHYYKGQGDSAHEFSDETSNMVEFTMIPDWASEPVQGIARADQVTVRPS